MNLNDYFFDQEIKEVFSDFESTPSGDVWNSIAAGLASNSKQTRPAALWYKIAAGLAILLSTSFSAYFLFFPKGKLADNQAATLNEAIEAIATIDHPTTKPVFENQLSQGQTLASSSNLFTSTAAPRVGSAEEPTPTTPDFFETISLNKLNPITASLQVEKNYKLSVGKPEALEAKPSRFGDVLAQATPSSTESEFSLGAYISPQYSFRSIPDDIVTSLPFNNLEGPLFTYGAGVFAQFKVFGRLSFQIGVEYNVTGQFLKHISSIPHQPHFPKIEINPNTESGHPQSLVTSLGIINFHDGSLVFVDTRDQRLRSTNDFFSSNNLRKMQKDNLGISQQLTFIDIPISFRYRLIDFYNLSFSIKGGGGVGYLLLNQVFLGRDVFSSSIGRTQGLNKMSFFATGGFSIDYRLSNTLKLTIEPTFQRYLRSLFEESTSFAPATPFKYSINTGVTIDF